MRVCSRLSLFSPFYSPTLHDISSYPIDKDTDSDIDTQNRDTDRTRRLNDMNEKRNSTLVSEKGSSKKSNNEI